jgi:hypothetical protein
MLSLAVVGAATSGKSLKPAMPHPAGWSPPAGYVSGIVAVVPIRKLTDAAARGIFLTHRALVMKTSEFR